MSGVASSACEGCLTRAWLLARLAGHLDPVRRDILALLRLADNELIAAVGGVDGPAIRRELGALQAVDLRERARDHGLDIVCRHHHRYPRRLRELDAPPAVLHVCGARPLEELVGEAVAIVGSRRASPYGLEVARGLGRDLAASGVTVLSGMAVGIDSAAHEGALQGDGPTVAVLPCGAERPYPPSRRALRERILATGAVISELPPGTGARRWSFPARNRLVAALASMTIVVEGGERSGALITARLAQALGRAVGAVPGRVTSEAAAGPHSLLAGGARLVTGAQDVLDAVFGVGARSAALPARPKLAPQEQAVLTQLSAGDDSLGALERAGLDPAQALAALATLELAGYVRRGAGGRFTVTP